MKNVKHTQWAVGANGQWIAGGAHYPLPTAHYTLLCLNKVTFHQ